MRAFARQHCEGFVHLYSNGSPSLAEEMAESKKQFGLRNSDCGLRTRAREGLFLPFEQSSKAANREGHEGVVATRVPVAIHVRTRVAA